MRMFILSQEYWTDLSMLHDLIYAKISPSDNILTLALNSNGQKALLCPYCGKLLHFRSYVIRSKKVLDGVTVKIAVPIYYCVNKDCPSHLRGAEKICQQYHEVVPDCFAYGCSYFRSIIRACINLLNRPSTHVSQSLRDFFNANRVTVRRWHQRFHNFYSYSFSSRLRPG